MLYDEKMREKAFFVLLALGGLGYYEKFVSGNEATGHNHGSEKCCGHRDQTTNNFARKLFPSRYEGTPGREIQYKEYCLLGDHF